MWPDVLLFGIPVSDIIYWLCCFVWTVSFVVFCVLLVDKKYNKKRIDFTLSTFLITAVLLIII